MVKRLRRRPLTAESGVRFPMGVPIFNAKLKGIELSVKKKLPFGKFFSAGAGIEQRPARKACEAARFIWKGG